MNILKLIIYFFLGFLGILFLVLTIIFGLCTVYYGLGAVSYDFMRDDFDDPTRDFLINLGMFISSFLITIVICAGMRKTKPKLQNLKEGKLEF